MNTNSTKNSSSARFRLVFLAASAGVFIFSGFYFFLFQQIGKWWDKQMIWNLFLHRSPQQWISKHHDENGAVWGERNGFCLLFYVHARSSLRDSMWNFPIAIKSSRFWCDYVLGSFSSPPSRYKVFHYPFMLWRCDCVILWESIEKATASTCSDSCLIHIQMYTHQLLTDGWKIS